MSKTGTDQPQKVVLNPLVGLRGSYLDLTTFLPCALLQLFFSVWFRELTV